MMTPEKVAIVQDADAICREEVDKLAMDQQPQPVLCRADQHAERRRHG